MPGDRIVVFVFKSGLVNSLTTYDVVIVGSGVTGLVGAVAAAKAHRSVIILERSDLIGGCSSWAFSATWVPGSAAAISAGIRDEREAVMAYLAYIGGGENEPKRTLALLDKAPAMLRFLIDIGIKVSLLPDISDMLIGKAPGATKGGRMLEIASVPGTLLGDWRELLRTPHGDFWRLPISELTFLAPPDVPQAIEAAVARDQLGQGASLVAQLMRVVRDLGIEVRCNADVSTLMQSAGRVTGVTLKNGTEIGARSGVLLGTGSYLSNNALVAQLDSLPGYGSAMPDFSDGNGLKLAAKIGASTGNRRNNLAIVVGYENPDTPGVPLTIASVKELPRAHVIMVNARGRRFGNESMFQDYATALRAYDSTTRKPVNLPCWMVFDSAYVDRWGFSGTPPRSVPTWVLVGSTLAELAQTSGIDAEGLEATVLRFNTFAESGVDEDFDRAPGWDMTPGTGAGRNASLGAILKPPFYAVKLKPSLEVGGSGLRTDECARVLDWSGEPIGGLYAAGDVTLHDDFGTGYQAGLSLTSAMTFACIAIDHLETVPPSGRQDLVADEGAHR